MRIIAEAREDVAKCWGRQKRKETDYRPILYLVRTECEEGTLVLNTVTGQMVLLTAEELTALDALPGPLPEVLLPLMEAHYVVPVDFDEKKSVNQLRALLLRLNHKKEITSYTILPTTACNARCFYCYEAGYPHHTMTEETADQVVEFIAAHCGNEEVHITWFGGEPMVGMKRIDQICDGLRAKEIEFTSSMISNGYLFNQELAQHAKEVWNLKQIQITLDGTEEVYNKAKAYVSVIGSPYKIVLSNIDFLLDASIKVRIRLNIDLYNIENLATLVQELSKKFANRENLDIYCANIYENVGFSPIMHTSKELFSLEYQRINLEKVLKSYHLLHMKQKLSSLRINQCMADNDNAILINPEGGIGKCEHHSNDRLIGTLTNGITNTTEQKLWKKLKTDDSCFNCPNYPACIHLENCIPMHSCSKIICENFLKSLSEVMLLKYHGLIGQDFETQSLCP